MFDRKKVADRLSELRKEKGMSQDELANALETSRSAIAAYETGQRIPRDEVKVRIAEFFGVSVQAIFFAA